MATTDILTITDGVHQVNLGGTSATLIETGDRPVLIDTGWKWSHRRLQFNLLALGYPLADIGVLAIKHSHPDHSGGANNIKQKRDSRIARHSKDVMTTACREETPEVIETWY